LEKVYVKVKPPTVSVTRLSQFTPFEPLSQKTLYLITESRPVVGSVIAFQLI